MLRCLPLRPADAPKTKTTTARRRFFTVWDEHSNRYKPSIHLTRFFFVVVVVVNLNGRTHVLLQTRGVEQQNKTLRNCGRRDEWVTQKVRHRVGAKTSWEVGWRIIKTQLRYTSLYVNTTTSRFSSRLLGSISWSNDRHRPWHLHPPPTTGWDSSAWPPVWLMPQQCSFGTERQTPSENSFYAMHILPEFFQTCPYLISRRRDRAAEWEEIL